MPPLLKCSPQRFIPLRAFLCKTLKRCADFDYIHHIAQHIYLDATNSVVQWLCNFIKRRTQIVENQ